MTTSYDTVPYDHVGLVRLGGDLGATRYVDVPNDWTVGDQVGVLLGAPDNVHVVFPADTPAVVLDVEPGGSAATGSSPMDPMDLAALWQERYEAAVGLLAKVYRDGCTIVAHGPHRATTIEGIPVTDAQARVLYDADEYVDVEAL